jgi:transposase
VIIDLTPVREGTGPARLLDMVSGRSKQVLTSWLEAQPAGFRDGIEVARWTGSPASRPPTNCRRDGVMDPFHVVALAGEAMDRCRHRIQPQTWRHRDRTAGPLSGIRRVLRTGTDLLTER